MHGRRSGDMTGDEPSDESLDETLARSGHDHHFLERLARVDADVADRALALYRAPLVVAELCAAAGGESRDRKSVV